MAIRCAYLNAVAIGALAAGVVAVGIGFSEGIRCRSAKLAILAAIFGAVLGGAAGAGGGWSAQRVTFLESLYSLNSEQLGDSPRLIAIQAACWILAGLGVGIGLAIPLSGKFGATVRAAGRGAAGGLLAALIYPILTVIVGILLPGGENLELVPETALNRLLWLEAGAICIAMAIGAVAPRTISTEPVPVSA